MSVPNSLPSETHRSRLFSILADNSKEGRATSILMSCLEIVDEFRTKLLSKLGVNKLQHHNIRTYTEVVFPGSKDTTRLRPDGLILVERGKYNWSAIIEAKIGKNDLYSDQIENYLKLAKSQGVNSVITISNQFSTLPDLHPVAVSKNLIRSVKLHHWSWMYILTEALMLIENDEISDPEQKYILNELIRFLRDDNTVVNGFVQMPESWKEITTKAKHGKYFKPTEKVILEVIGAWHQEGRDISLILSRNLGLLVQVKISRKLLSDHNLRISNDAKLLCTESRMQHIFDVPNAASDIEVVADLKASTISVGMKLEAPKRATIKGQVNWLLNQLRHSKSSIVRVEFDWKGQYPPDSVSLHELMNDKDQVLSNFPKAELREFEVAAIVMDVNKFMNRKSFISTLEDTIVNFYEDVGQHLSAWQPPAPKPIKNKPESIDPTIEKVENNDLTPGINEDIDT